MPKNTKEDVKSSKVYVAKSKIHGKGLFAAEKIKKGEVLATLKTRKAKKDGPHVLWVDDGKTGYKVLCDFKYINHSNDPNVAYYDDLTVVALRNIAPGEELTHYYGEEWEELVSS